MQYQLPARVEVQPTVRDVGPETQRARAELGVAGLDALDEAAPDLRELRVRHGIQLAAESVEKSGGQPRNFGRAMARALHRKHQPRHLHHRPRRGVDQVADAVGGAQIEEKRRFQQLREETHARQFGVGFFLALEVHHQSRVAVVDI